MKIVSFWDIASCSLVEYDRHFKDVFASITIALMLEDIRTSETSVRLYKNALFNIPEIVVIIRIIHMSRVGLNQFAMK
jgi:hypothetical protein